MLKVIRDNGGSINPAETAIEAPLSMKEADRRLPELADSSYFLVEYQGGALVYSRTIGS